MVDKRVLHDSMFIEDIDLLYLQLRNNPIHCYDMITKGISNDWLGLAWLVIISTHRRFPSFRIG